MPPSRAASSVVEGVVLRRPLGIVALLQLHSYVLVTAILLYLVISAPVLVALDWHYVGGGSEAEKIHPATYMLVAALCFSLIIDRQFRLRVMTRFLTDGYILSFFAAVTATAGYAYLFKGASLAPFIDTFYSAILTAVILTCVRQRPLIFFRRLVDIFFVTSALIIFWETATNRNLLSELLISSSAVREGIGILLPHESASGFNRVSALFGHPLDAALLLGAYCVSNFVALRVRFSRAVVVRLLMSALTLVAIFPTGGRTSLVVTIVSLVLYSAYCVIGWGVKGKINKAAITLATITVVIVGLLGIVLYSVGFFDPMLDRFHSDYGSALSRDYAFEILGQARGSALWFGLSIQDILGFQRSFGLIAIEISWINFILVGGLITAIPLFVTYLLFLFRSMRRYCSFGIYFVSSLLVVATAASNGIWSKTTVLAASLGIAISFLRRDFQPAERLRTLPTM